MRFLLPLLVLSLITAGCGTKVVRTDVDKRTDYSGAWNDTDARMVFEEMLKDCLAGTWTNDFNKASGRNPVVIVGSIKNQTYEHIDSNIFVEALERGLINSGKVTFVASKDARNEIRDERADQQKGNTEPSTIKATGHEKGADFMLQGTVSSIKDMVKGKYAVFYQVTLELVDMSTNEKRWVGQQQIKKIVIRPSTTL